MREWYYGSLTGGDPPASVDNSEVPAGVETYHAWVHSAIQNELSAIGTQPRTAAVVALSRSQRKHMLRWCPPLKLVCNILLRCVPGQFIFSSDAKSLRQPRAHKQLHPAKFKLLGLIMKRRTIRLLRRTTKTLQALCKCTLVMTTSLIRRLAAHMCIPSTNSLCLRKQTRNKPTTYVQMQSIDSVRDAPIGSTAFVHVGALSLMPERPFQSHASAGK